MHGENVIIMVGINGGGGEACYDHLMSMRLFHFDKSIRYSFELQKLRANGYRHYLDC